MNAVINTTTDQGVTTNTPSPDHKALEQQYGLGLYPKRDAVMVRGAGAVLFDEDGRQYIDCAAGMHGTTFGGNPIACAAALATIDVMHDERLAERATVLRLLPPLVISKAQIDVVVGHLHELLA